MGTLAGAFYDKGKFHYLRISMPTALYQFADFFFFAFHSALILFNSLGWLFQKTRFYNLITLSLTAFSWFILGIWYGWGYCFCTDWHWNVREKLGFIDHTNSYVDLLLIKITGMDFPNSLVDTATVTVFTISLIMSVWLNVRDFRNKNIDS